MTLYVVDDGHKVRLIEAKTRAGARSFAARKSIKVEAATPSASHKLAHQGIKIEVATREDQEDAAEQSDAFPQEQSSGTAAETAAAAER